MEKCKNVKKNIEKQKSRTVNLQKCRKVEWAIREIRKSVQSKPIRAI